MHKNDVSYYAELQNKNTRNTLKKRVPHDTRNAGRCQYEGWGLKNLKIGPKVLARRSNDFCVILLATEQAAK